MEHAILTISLTDAGYLRSYRNRNIDLDSLIDMIEEVHDRLVDLRDGKRGRVLCPKAIAKRLKMMGK